MPEPDPGRTDGQQASLLRVSQCRDPARHQRVDQPPVDHGRHDGQLLEIVSRARIEAAEAGQHSVGDRGRHLLVSPAASTSVTKNGLPPVTSWTRAGSGDPGALSRRTASSDNPASGSRRNLAVQAA